MERPDTPRDLVHGGRALVAAFGSRDEAAQTAHALHHDGFRKTWIGVTRSETTADGSIRLSAEGASLGERVGRFFSHEREGRTLYDELVRHGVGVAAAHEIETEIEPDAAILTVDGANHPELAAAVIESRGGYVLAGESFAANDAERGEGGARTGSEVLGYGDPARFARGHTIDEHGVLQLREERLRTGEEQPGVPVIREELFLERQGAGATARSAAASASAAAGDRIRIPVMREEAVVTKRQVDETGTPGSPR